MAGERYAWERALLADPAVKGSRLAVLLAVATHYDRARETVTVSRTTLARECLGHEEGQEQVRTIARALEWARAHGYLVTIKAGHRLGDGRTLASVHALALPLPGTVPTAPQCVSGDTVTCQSTGHPRHGEPTSTCHPGPTDPRLNVSSEPSQRVTGDTPSVASPSGEDLSELPRASEEAEPMRDYPVSSADRAERAEAGPLPVAAEQAGRDAARDVVERWHPTLRPAEVDAVLDLIAGRARFGYRGASNREVRESCVNDVLAQRKREGDGSAWYAALPPDDLRLYEEAARLSLAGEDNHDPEPAVLRARVIRMQFRRTRAA